MRVNRRIFLGSLLGTVFATDFFARLESEEWQRVVLPYRMLFREAGSGRYYQAPGVEKIELVEKEGRNGYVFTSELLYPQQAIVFDGSVLLTEAGQVITESKFDRPTNMQPKDAMYVMHELTIQLDREEKLSVEEVVDARRTMFFRGRPMLRLSDWQKVLL